MSRIPFLRRRSSDDPATDQPTPRRRRAEGGQALVVFVLLSVVLVGAVAIVTDISWLWYGNQRMQRAADAAALAGAIYLPGNTTQAYASARAEATKNGFTNGVDGVSVTPIQDPLNRRRLIVTINGPVGAFFARAVGFTQFGSEAVSRAEYVLPVPMGSPENYYGVGYFVATSSATNMVWGNWTNGTVAYRTATTFTPNQTNNNNGNWSNPGRTTADDNQFAVSAALATGSATSQQILGGFGHQGQVPNPTANQEQEIRGITLQMRARYGGSGNPTSGCQLRVALSWNGGSSWSTEQTYTLTSSETAQTYGSASSMNPWGSHTWTRAELANLVVRLTFARGGTNGGNCAATRTAEVDYLRVQVDYRTRTQSPVTSYSIDGPQDLKGPNNETLRRQGFWGSMQSQGAPNIQGDAFMTYYDRRTSVNNASYDPAQYYQYGVDIPTGASNGGIWIYDPGFCDVTTAAGTGENWTVGGANGASTRAPVSGYYVVYDTRNTPYELADDVVVATFGNTYRRSNYQDVTARNAAGSSTISGIPDCRDETWHDRWVQIASGLGGGKTYRIHTFSTDPTSSSDQLSSTALNNFAIFARASGGTPKVYGIGAMEAYFRLPGGQKTEFYMSQIDAVHAGKTMVIELWDPGDTGNLSASLEILKPGATDYVPATFSHNATQGSADATACSGYSGTNVTSVTTNTGGSSRYNGCWLTITIPLPTNYDAPHPSSDHITDEGGWWKIRYTMGGSTSDFSTDLTTWKVSIRGNPVHLVVP